MAIEIQKSSSIFRDGRYLNFRNPATECYPAVYWFWHRIPTPNEIDRQLGEIRDAGYRTFLIQPRLAFPLQDYLSAGYLTAYRQAMVTAKSLDLRAGLYDDYNWISGHAAGRTVTGHNHLCERHLFWSSTAVNTSKVVCTISEIHSLLEDGLGSEFSDWCYQGGKPQWEDWQIFKAFVFPLDDGLSDAHPSVDVTLYCKVVTTGASGCRIVAELPKNISSRMKMVVFVSARCRNSRLINYLLPEAANRFIEVGYEPYKRSIGDFFGNPLTFIFFDQPYSGFYSWKEREGNVRNSLMFDETLVSAFREAHQYPLEEALLALVLPDSPQSPRLRCDFFEAYGKLARESFLAPISRWAKQNELEITGHELMSFVGCWGFVGGLPEIDSRCNFGADYFSIDAYKTLSTVDACNYHPQLSARFGASTARAHGRKGCIIEQYTVPIDPEMPAPAGQWGLTLDELRSQAIRHLFFGARQFLFHGFYQTDGADNNFTLMRNPRFDFPPGINFEPWFRFHADFSHEIARLSAFLESGETLANVAVLYPLRTYWDAGPQHPFAIESAFWNRWLSEHGYAFDIVDESQLLDIGDGPGDPAGFLRNYRILILPGVSVVQNRRFADVLENYLTAGGFVIASGLLPIASHEKGQDAELRDHILSFIANYPSAFYFFSLNDSPPAEQKLAELLKQKISRPVRFRYSGDTSQPLWTWVGKDGDEWKIAIFNDSLKRCQTTISIAETKLIPQLWDPTTGTKKKWSCFAWQDKETDIFLYIEPKGLRCFSLLKTKNEFVPRIEGIFGDVENCQIYYDDGLGLSAAIKFHSAEKVKLEVYSPKKPTIQNALFEKQIIPLSKNLWRLVFQIPPLPLPIRLDKEWSFRLAEEPHPKPINIDEGWEKAYPAYSGTGYYGCEFNLTKDDLAYQWDLIFKDIVSTVTVFLNGSCIGKRGWPPYRLELPGSHLKKTENRLMLEISNTAGNAYYYNTPYAGSSPQPAGLLGEPILKPATVIQLLA